MNLSTSLARRLGAFAAERHPMVVDEVLAAIDAALRKSPQIQNDASRIDSLRTLFRAELAARLSARGAAMSHLPETTPRTSATERVEQARVGILDDCDGF